MSNGKSCLCLKPETLYASGLSSYTSQKLTLFPSQKLVVSLKASLPTPIQLWNLTDRAQGKGVNAVGPSAVTIPKGESTLTVEVNSSGSAIQASTSPAMGSPALLVFDRGTDPVVFELQNVDPNRLFIGNATIYLNGSTQPFNNYGYCFTTQDGSEPAACTACTEGNILSGCIASDISFSDLTSLDVLIIVAGIIFASIIIKRII